VHEFNRLNIELISFREQIDTGGPAGPRDHGHHRGDCKPRTQI
jgi:hypothetical protein